MDSVESRTDWGLPAPANFLVPSLLALGLAVFTALSFRPLADFAFFTAMVVTAFAYDWAKYRSRKRSEHLEYRLSRRDRFDRNR